MAVHLATALIAIVALVISLTILSGRLDTTEHNVSKVSTRQNALLCPLIVQALAKAHGGTIILEGDPSLARCIERGAHVHVR